MSATHRRARLLQADLDGFPLNAMITVRPVGEFFGGPSSPTSRTNFGILAGRLLSQDGANRARDARGAIDLVVGAAENPLPASTFSKLCAQEPHQDEGQSGP